MNARLYRLLPRQADNRFDGHRAALWLLGLFIALKIVMGVNSIFHTESVAVGADGIPLDSYSPATARQVLMLFALTSLGQLMLALVGLTVLVRYRSLVPIVFAAFLGEQLARRLIVQSYAVVRTESGSARLVYQSRADGLAGARAAAVAGTASPGAFLAVPIHSAGRS